MSLIVDNSPSYYASFERVKKDFNVSDYSIHLIKAFNLQKAYLSIESVYYIKYSDIKKSKNSESTFEYELDEDEYVRTEREETKSETTICNVAYYLSSKVNHFDNNIFPDIPNIKNVILSVVLISVNPKTKENILNGSINYFREKSHKKIEYVPLIDDLQNIYDELIKPNEQLKELINIDNSKTSTQIQWYGSQSELIELTKALIENGNLKGRQEDIFEAIQENFNFKLNNIDQAITKFNYRKDGKTKFLDTLQSSLYKYISYKLDKYL